MPHHNTYMNGKEGLVRLVSAASQLAERLPVHESHLAQRLRVRALEVFEDGHWYFSAKQHEVARTREFLADFISKLDVLSGIVGLVKHRAWAHNGICATLEAEVKQIADELRSEANVLAEGLVPFTFEAVAQEQKVAQPSESAKSTYPQERLQEVRPQPAAVAVSYPQAAREVVAQVQPTQEQPNAVSVVWKAGGIATKGWGFNEGLLPDRQRHIFILMRERKQASLKDICRLFPNLSEKTLRNDLNMLVERKLINRVGVAPRSYYVTA